MTKKNKLNDANKGKYENPKKTTDTQLNNMVSNNNAIIGQKANNNNVNNNQLKNDTYESVCSPEDTAERTKMAQRHSIAVNNTISTTNAHNSNSSMPSNVNCGNNNNRVLKRVISAPVATIETKGNFASSLSLALSLTHSNCPSLLNSLLALQSTDVWQHCNWKSSQLEPVYPQTCTYFFITLKSINFSNCHSLMHLIIMTAKKNIFLFSK